MRIRTRRNKLIIEPPASATGDIAFNQPDSGRSQTLPRSEEVDEQDVKNIEVQITRSASIVRLNGDPLRTAELVSRLRTMLANKTREEDRVVVVKSSPDSQYQHWIRITGMIEEAGGIITIQTEEVREVRVD